MLKLLKLNGPPPLLLLFVVVLGVAAITRLPLLSQPRSVVFDEVHFGKFVNSYALIHDRSFDIHPPHAKLLIAGVVALSGCREAFPFSRIGDPYSPEFPVWAFRLVPAFAGVGVPVAFLWVLLLLGAAPRWAFLAGLAIALDNGFILQSRVISLDMALLLFELLAFASYLRARQSHGLMWFALSGAAAAWAVGSKLTGLVAPALIAVHFFVEAFLARVRGGDNAKRPRLLWPALVFLVSFLFFYLLPWWLHFHLLTSPGFADRFYLGSGHFLPDVIAAHSAMLRANYFLKTPHPDASPWWSWPAMLVAPFYWSSGGRQLHLWGNPVVWWGYTSALIGLLVWRFAKGFKGTSCSGQRGSLFWLLLGYLLCLSPFMGIPRALFLYHYFTPLLFSIAFVTVALSQSGWWVERKFDWILASLILIGFLGVSVVTYPQAPSPWSRLMITFIRSLRQL